MEKGDDLRVVPVFRFQWFIQFGRVIDLYGRMIDNSPKLKFTLV